MVPPPRQKFSFRSDSPFSAEWSTFIILKYGELKSTAAVRRAFGIKFRPQNPRKVPQQVQFQRVIDNFIKTAPVRPQSGQKSIIWNRKIVGTWDTLGIKIPKPPYISSLKMVGFVHFSNFYSIREILQVTVLLDHPVAYVAMCYGHSDMQKVWKLVQEYFCLEETSTKEVCNNT